VLGIDETRRGRPRWSRTDDGSWNRLERFETNFVDLSGSGGLLGQTAGRTAKSVVAWLDKRGEDWKAHVEFVAIDPCATYRSAVEQGQDARGHGPRLTERTVAIHGGHRCCGWGRPWRDSTSLTGKPEASWPSSAARKKQAAARMRAPARQSTAAGWAVRPPGWRWSRPRAAEAAAPRRRSPSLSNDVPVPL
jgi:hypothetical protein